MPSSPDYPLEAPNLSLLQWVYNGQSCEVNNLRHCSALLVTNMQQNLFALAKNVIPIFDWTIKSQALRHSFLAFAGMVTSGDLTMREKDNIGRARSALLTRVDFPGALDEGDLFASLLLAFTTWANPSPEPENYKIHLKGFVAIMEYISSQKRNSLSRFWPMGRDMFFSIPYWQMPGNSDLDYFDFYDQCTKVMGPPSLAQCLAYIDDSTALRDSIRYHLRTLLRVFAVALGRETAEIPQTVKNAMDSITADLDIIETYIDKCLLLNVQLTSLGPSEEPSATTLATILDFRVCKFLLTLLEDYGSRIQERLKEQITMYNALLVVEKLSQIAKFNVQADGIWSINLDGVRPEPHIFAMAMATLSIPCEVLRTVYIGDGEFRNLCHADLFFSSYR